MELNNFADNIKFGVVIIDLAPEDTPMNTES